MSNLYKFVQSLPIQETGRDFIRKRASARELVLHLTAPENYERSTEYVPDVSVSLILSTTKKLPRFVKDKIRPSQDRIIFGDNSLGGLCLNGRGMPIEIFLHDILMAEKDPSGNMFEEIFWHEYVHGAEGIHQNKDGVWERVEPWSYRLQQRMIESDREQGFDPFEGFKGAKKLKTLLKYFREGTDVQENVSEIFARAACAYMVTVRDTKNAPEFGNPSILLPKDIPDFSTPLNRNVRELFEGVARYSPASQQTMVDEMPMMMVHIHAMYGCKFPD